MGQFHVIAGGSKDAIYPIVRRIGLVDVGASLRQGLDDFWSKPSHYAFLCLIYPVAGVVLATWTAGANLLPLLFPLMSGFALVGPVAAIGLYEISRRRELGLDTSWQHALEVRNSPALPAILALGVMLAVIFIFWLMSAQFLYERLFGQEAPASLTSFLQEIFTTARGWQLIIYGNITGFLFALAVLCTTVVAFPLLLDRDVVQRQLSTLRSKRLQSILWKSCCGGSSWRCYCWPGSFCFLPDLRSCFQYWVMRPGIFIAGWSSRTMAAWACRPKQIPGSASA